MRGSRPYDVVERFYEGRKRFYDEGNSFSEAGKALYDAGSPSYEAGIARYDAGKRGYDGGKTLYDREKPSYDGKSVDIGARSVLEWVPLVTNKKSIARRSFFMADTDRDWYPASMDARRAWHANLKLRRPDFEAKYPILGTLKTQIINDCDWIMWWVDTRHAEDEWSQQLTRYFNTIAGKDGGADPPSPIVWASPPGMPGEVAPGLEKRIRDIRREVVNSSNYATADGEALGFETPVGIDAPVDEMTPEFELKTLAQFELRATFRKLGMSAVKFQYRYKGGEWHPAATLITSPGTFTVPPQTPGEAQQVEVRAVFMQGNDEVGNWSDAKAAFIGP